MLVVFLKVTQISLFFLEYEKEKSLNHYFLPDLRLIGSELQHEDCI